MNIPTGITQVIPVSGISGPAKARRSTGVVYVNKDTFFDYHPDIQYYILSHEAGHLVLDTDNELAADAWGFRNYIQSGRSLTKSVEALSKVLRFNNPEHHLRLTNQINRALNYDYKHNGNNKANPENFWNNMYIEDNNFGGRAKKRRQARKDKRAAKYDRRQTRKDDRLASKNNKRNAKAEVKLSRAAKNNAKAESNLLLAKKGIDTSGKGLKMFKSGASAITGALIKGNPLLNLAGSLLGGGGASPQNRTTADQLAAANTTTDEKDNTTMYIVIGVGLVVVIAAAFLLKKK